MDKEFEEKSKDLIEYCKTNKIPVFISGYNKEEKKYVNYGVTPTSLDMKIENDKYPEFLRVLLGFDFNFYKERE